MFQDFLEKSFLNNQLSDYIVSLSLFLVFIIIIRIYKHILLKRLKKWSKKTATALDDFLVYITEKNSLPLLYFGAFYLCIHRLTLNTDLNKVINVLGLIFLTFFGVRFLLALIVFGIETYWLKREKDEAKKDALKGVLTVTKLLVWSLAIIILLDNLGIRISALVAGLGIGGIAIALAAQAILGDLFSYFTIFFDRPFEIGDFIIIDDYLGVIEHIGIKTTRVRSLSGEQLVFSNTDLTNSRVRNYKKMERRRVAFKIGVTYQTSLKQLKEIPVIVTDIIKDINDTVFDRTHFSSYGDFSLIFEIVYYVLTNDYNKYMDIQQEINLKLKEKFEKNKIEFAYPTQLIYLNKS